jgi:hypothetical protein
MAMSSRRSLLYSIKRPVRFRRQFGRVLPTAPFLRPQQFVLAAALILIAASARAQEPGPVVGYIEGDDVSIASNVAAISVPRDAASTSAIANGAVVTVGSGGQARLMLAAGGEIDVCGPAKFSLLQSRAAITVALDAGTLRLELPASTSLRVFTPMIIATPLEINGTPGDATVMLRQDDSLCVKAASGALLIESQFTNEKIVVPQSGQFWFEQGQLVPVARTDISCECLLPEARYVLPSPPLAAPSLSNIAPRETTAAKPSAHRKTESERQAEAESGVEYGILSHPNDAHPVEQQASAAPARAPELMPFYRVDMPPLAFSALSPVPPPASAKEMILLIRTTRIDPDFEFAGHVNPPPMGQAAKNLAAGNSRAQKAAGQKHGFWARVKRFLAGSSS